MTARYWDAFDAFARDLGHDLDLRTRGSHQHFRLIPIGGVPPTHAHFAVAASGPSRVREAGNRVQLVLEGRYAAAYFAALSGQRRRIEEQIPRVQWLDQPAGKASHVEVRKAHHLDDPTEWPDDFQWLLDQLLLFRQVLGPLVSDIRQGIR